MNLLEFDSKFIIPPLVMGSDDVYDWLQKYRKELNGKLVEISCNDVTSQAIISTDFGDEFGLVLFFSDCEDLMADGYCDSDGFRDFTDEMIEACNHASRNYIWDVSKHRKDTSSIRLL